MRQPTVTFPSRTLGDSHALSQSAPRCHHRTFHWQSFTRPPPAAAARARAQGLWPCGRGGMPGGRGGKSGKAGKAVTTAGGKRYYARKVAELEQVLESKLQELEQLRDRRHALKTKEGA